MSRNRERARAVDIVELLELRGLATSKRIKMLRHQDQRFDIQALYKKGQIAEYQSIQGHDVLKCEYVVSFLGLENRRALFIGVWQVMARKSASEIVRNPAFLYPEMYDTVTVAYDMDEVEGFEDLKHRVVVDWGRSTRSWHQWLRSKRVVEVLPVGYASAFPGYLDFVLEFDELKKIIENPEANRVWHSMLSAVAGIYLITDTETGKQYVGSAYGRNGILGRWRSYVTTRHGGNALLRKLVEGNPGYERNFRITILRTLPTTLTDREVIQYERLYKNKLGTLAHGLNLN